MTEYQLLHLRFLRMKEGFPELNHRGHEPGFDGMMNGVPPSWTERPLDWMTSTGQRRIAEREFYRPMERI